MSPINHAQKIFGWTEIIIGAAWSIIFILSSVGFVYCLFYPAETEIGGAITLAAMLLSIPAPFFLTAGIGLLKTKSWARKMNTIVVPVVISLLAVPLISLQAMAGKDARGYLLVEIPVALLLSLSPILCFNWHRPVVRKLLLIIILSAILFITGLHIYSYFSTRTEVKIFNENGKLISQGRWEVEGLTGVRRIYEGGKLTLEASYVDGEADGITRYYDKKTGALTTEWLYKNGTSVSVKHYDGNSSKP